ncbi:2-C-methyl-D-erythritol 4-phosphate cytidylyltransferase [Paenarthrobacter sp. Z7-10]|uniref:2-C-methyl-D-erythritol 4-phosphate cytidylyltransferase n=1 Tax=Paenarthrobacter sp. Z7-10 TaxID=2787635 RepID=UPI0022A9BBCE|nr:2-C-methyl-D-erythritol 4-phosphate cytidylyltransferase [Paenarthrobacter sp. Z7-10]MCZ2404152.1 2-C-methyl-D-erythritol 4-phosphate cytidylyltransferase [Paenarthrobacter sp. Z7-10]
METEAGRKIAVIVVAAGSGERLGRGVPKARVPLGGELMLTHALRGVLAADIASHICVALPDGDAELQRLCGVLAAETSAAGGPEITVVDGGSSRAESVRSALAALAPEVSAVVIHDAARALTPPEVFHRIAASLAEGALAVIPALAVVDTIKTVENSDPGTASIAPERVRCTPARDQLRAVQTPQGFDLATLRRAHEQAALLTQSQAAEVTDDAMLVEAMGVAVYVVKGSARSLKITTPTDLLLAEALLEGPLAPRWVEG